MSIPVAPAPAAIDESPTAANAPAAAASASAAPPSARLGAGGFHIPSLDGIRAVSFLLVFLHHGTLHGIVPGGLGVTTFFFLSGFLITTLLRLEAEARGRISLRQFYLRRTLRIFPPLYLSLGAAVLAAVFVFAHPVNLAALLAQAAFLGNYYSLSVPESHILPGTAVIWSLAVEEHFYLLFPVFYIALRRAFPRPVAQVAVMAAVCLGALLWRTYLVTHSDLDDVRQLQRISLCTDTRIDALLFGCMLAVFYNPAVDRYPLGRRAADLLAVAGVVVLLAATFGPGKAFRESGRYTLQSLALAPLFVAAIRGHDRWPWRWLNHRWVSHLGVLSYSLYLFHMMIQEAVQHYVGRLGLVTCDAIALAISLLVAQAMFVAVDRPLARLRKRLSRTPANATPAPAA